MPRTRRCSRRSAGFTLVEVVIVITLTGVLAAMVGSFIVRPVQAYLASSARAALVDQADHTLRRIGRDLRIALPNSVRVSASQRALELIPTTAGARYATEGAGALNFGTLDTAFAVVGPPLALGASQNLVFYNLGPTVPGSDAYAPNGSAAEQAVSNRRTATNAAGPATTVNLSSLAALPVDGGDPLPALRSDRRSTDIVALTRGGWSNTAAVCGRPARGREDAIRCQWRRAGGAPAGARRLPLSRRGAARTLA